MIYQDFQGKQLSMLGFGTLRLPLQADGSVDEEQLAEMVRYAMEHGVNYFDTAYAYHQGNAERVIGRALKAYPRESFYLADKFPGHQIMDRYDPRSEEEQSSEHCTVRLHTCGLYSAVSLPVRYTTISAECFPRVTTEPECRDL